MQPKSGIPSKPVTYNGVTYPSRAEFCRQLGVDDWKIRIIMRRKHCSYVYVGKAIEHPRDFFPTIEWFVAYNYNEGKLTFATVPSPYRVLQEFNEKLETVTESAL